MIGKKSKNILNVIDSGVEAGVDCTGVTEGNVFEIASTAQGCAGGIEHFADQFIGLFEAPTPSPTPPPAPTPAAPLLPRDGNGNLTAPSKLIPGGNNIDVFKARQLYNLIVPDIPPLNLYNGNTIPTRCRNIYDILEGIDTGTLTNTEKFDNLLNSGFDVQYGLVGGHKDDGWEATTVTSIFYDGTVERNLSYDTMAWRELIGSKKPTAGFTLPSDFWPYDTLVSDGEGYVKYTGDLSSDANKDDFHYFTIDGKQGDSDRSIN